MASSVAAADDDRRYADAETRRLLADIQRQSRLTHAQVGRLSVPARGGPRAADVLSVFGVLANQLRSLRRALGADGADGASGGALQHRILVPLQSTRVPEELSEVMSCFPPPGLVAEEQALLQGAAGSGGGPDGDGDLVAAEQRRGELLRTLHAYNDLAETLADVASQAVALTNNRASAASGSASAGAAAEAAGGGKNTAARPALTQDAQFKAGLAAFNNMANWGTHVD